MAAVAGLLKSRKRHTQELGVLRVAFGESVLALLHFLECEASGFFASKNFLHRGLAVGVFVVVTIYQSSTLLAMLGIHLEDVPVVITHHSVLARAPLLTRSVLFSKLLTADGITSVDSPAHAGG